MSEAPQFDRSESIPLTISRDPDGARYSVKLAGIELNRHIVTGGLQIQFVSLGDGPDRPQVTLTFAPDDAVELNLDAELLSYLQTLHDQQDKSEADRG